MSTTIIIPNYNGAHFMAPCLAALDKQTVAPDEIIVVDNGSTDGSLELLKSRYPSVRIIANDENLGFAAAVNIGIKASTSEFVLLLNNDTEAEPGMIEYLERAMRRHPNAFSVASKMIQLYHPEFLDSTGDLYTVTGWGVNRGNDRQSNLYNHTAHIFSACAGAALYRRQVFEQIGYFDEKHFAYLEDIDVGYRARLHGYCNVYEPKAVVRHFGSGTSGSKYNSFKVYLSARNSIWLNYKNMPNLQLLVNALPLAVGFLTKAVFFTCIGFGKDYLRGLKEGFSTFRKCQRVSFSPKLYRSCLVIEAELCLNLIKYAVYWILRAIERHQGRSKAR